MKLFSKADPDESNFMPATLAIQEQSPSAPARLVAYTLVVFFLCVLIWSMVGRLDVIAIAHGKVIPAGHSKTIQSPEAGVIADILVSEGETVIKGQLLVRFDVTELEAELERLQNEYWIIQALLERNRILLQAVTSSNTALPEFEVNAIPQEIRERHREQMTTQFASYQSNLSVKQASLQEHQFTLAALRVELDELEQQLPIVRRKLESVQVLQQQKLASEHESLQQEQTVISLQHQQEVLKQKISALEMAVHRASNEYRAYQQSYRNQLLAEQEKAKRKQSDLEKQRIQLTARLARMAIRAPIAGRVERLNLHTEGGVVTAAQALMSIVPEDAPLLIEAYVQNRNIGFLRQDQVATIKVDAFPFTRFGTLEGKVVSISSDAFNAKDQGWLFKTVVALPSAYLEAQGQAFRLSPGMSAQVEIRTGERKIIDYFLSPFQVKISESLNER